LLDVLYLVPNTADAAVARRYGMLREGGASVVVAGFRRTGQARPAIDEDSYIELGETFDSRFGQRILAVMSAMRMIRARLKGRPAPDVIVARNLETLVLANRLQAAWPNRPAIAYECLDIHRLLLRGDVVGRSLRILERRMTRNASLLLTSSPAFLREYFEAYAQSELPAVLVENKVHAGGSDTRGVNPALRAPGQSDVLRIGWFGALRCRKSLGILSAFTRAMDGKVEVVLRGRPAETEFDDFHGFVAAEPFLSYEGPYRNPADLATIYSDVHLAWAIDYFEAGQNSSWLLPNRVYEGCLHGAVPIAVEGTETAAFLRGHGIGIVLPDTEQATLAGVLGTLDPAALRLLAGHVAAKPPKLFSFDAADCRALVARLAAMVVPAPLEAVA
jgi:succinoglycan biosynthesis protein ExoL